MILPPCSVLASTLQHSQVQMTCVGGLGFGLTCALWVGSFLLGRWLLPQLSFTNWWGWALGGFWLLQRAGSMVRVYV
jgi:hypothetical protein